MTDLVLRFPSDVLAAVYLYEVTGQMSDGYFENSYYHEGHWQKWCSAEIVVNPEATPEGHCPYNLYKMFDTFAGYLEHCDMWPERILAYARGSKFLMHMYNKYEYEHYDTSRAVVEQLFEIQKVKNDEWRKDLPLVLTELDNFYGSREKAVEAISEWRDLSPYAKADMVRNIGLELHRHLICSGLDTKYMDKLALEDDGHSSYGIDDWYTRW